MVVIRSCYENDIKLLAVIFEDFPPIRITGRLLPAFLAVDATPPALIDLGEGDTLTAFSVGCAGMGSASSAHSDESHLEFFVESMGPD